MPLFPLRSAPGRLSSNPIQSDHPILQMAYLQTINKKRKYGLDAPNDFSLQPTHIKAFKVEPALLSCI